jgi:secreted trypsin-like serine protease
MSFQIFQIFFVFFMIIDCFAIFDKLTTAEVQPYIVNGSDATFAEFPFIVSLQTIVNTTHSYHSCAGTILSENWVLTVRSIADLITKAFSSLHFV